MGSMYRINGCHLLYIRKRSFYKIGCCRIQKRFTESWNKQQIFHGGTVFTPKLIAKRIIESDESVWDQITKIIFEYCPRMHLTEIGIGELENENANCFEILNQLKHEKFKFSKFGFPDHTSFEKIFKFKSQIK